jgi:hypothetical protein
MADVPPDIALWLVRHAREDHQRGRHPDGLLPWLTEVLTPPSATGPEDHAPVSLEEAGVSRRWVAAGQAAGETGLTPRSVRRLAATHRIHARRVGARSWLVDVDSVRDYLRGKTVSAMSPRHIDLAAAAAGEEAEHQETPGPDEMLRQRRARRAEAGINSGVFEPTREERRAARVEAVRAHNDAQDGGEE